MINLVIKKRFGDFQLDVALDAPAGVTALFGPSGSGKSSVTNAVAGIVAPDAGRVQIGPRVLFDSAGNVNVPIHQRNVGYVFQNARLFPHLSVEKNLRFGGAYDAGNVIAMLGLKDLLQRKPKHLSGGEAQRVALGRALMSNPDILLMDEPLAALDAPRKAEIIPYLTRLRDAARIPILYVSHDISEVARLATTVAVLNHGKVVCAGPAEDVLSDPSAVAFIGVDDAGSLVRTVVEKVDADLTYLRFEDGQLVLPGAVGKVGQAVRLRIPAQDVILSKDKPENISAINVLPVEIAQIAHGRGPGVAVRLRFGKAHFLARITRHSAQRMTLAQGDKIYAIIKATAVAGRDTDI